MANSERSYEASMSPEVRQALHEGEKPQRLSDGRITIGGKTYTSAEVDRLRRVEAALDEVCGDCENGP